MRTSHRRATRHSIAALTMLSALAFGSFASAQRSTPSTGPNASVEALLRRADAAQEATDYATALSLYQQAYTEEHDAVVLFNIGRMHVQLRHWAEGRRALQSFLEQIPDAPSRPLCERMIREADEELARERAAQNANNHGQGNNGPNRPPELIEVDGPAPRWPWAITGVGGALLLGSIVTGALYAVNDGGLRARGCYEPMPGTLDCDIREQQAVNDVKLLGGLTLGFAAGGAVLAGVGTTLAFVLPRPRVMVPRPVSLRPLPGGAMLVVGGSF